MSKTRRILATNIANVSDFKRSPMKVVNEANGETVAILNRSKPAFYCVPTKLYETMMDLLEESKES
jgi:antitoxin StbD